ncbi:MAG TPA: DUF2231 domain-containing protein [Myxococcota bacterium]|nr:DUF2231 domain-containing protein [Myxococcota bacterium]
MQRVSTRGSFVVVVLTTAAIILGFMATEGKTHEFHLGVSQASGAAPAERAHPLETALADLHPVAVHFPIAMLLSAALSEALLAATGRLSFRLVTRFLIWVGAVSAVGAACLGWLAGATVESAPQQLLAWHRWLGVTTALASIATLWVCERSRASPARLRAIVAATALLVGVTGYLGGELVHHPRAWSDASR